MVKNTIGYLVVIGRYAMLRQCGMYASLIVSPRKANGYQPPIRFPSPPACVPAPLCSAAGSPAPWCAHLLSDCEHRFPKAPVLSRATPRTRSVSHPSEWSKRSASIVEKMRTSHWTAPSGGAAPRPPPSFGGHPTQHSGQGRRAWLASLVLALGQARAAGWYARFSLALTSRAAATISVSWTPPGQLPLAGLSPRLRIDLGMFASLEGGPSFHPHRGRLASCRFLCPSSSLLAASLTRSYNLTITISSSRSHAQLWASRNQQSHHPIRICPSTSSARRQRRPRIMPCRQCRTQA